ncbi:GAF domain-containing protein [Lentzea sp. NPDC042327]|uniref:GAF domain-containing protein n=1 Tax=Lentzea sp. NPDC042327 TaxID=3154801 RepID=UPI0033D34521
MSTEQHRQVADVETYENEDEHRQVAVRHVCIACGVRTNAVGSAIYLRTTRNGVQPFETAGFCGVEIAELQTMLAEGPAFTATRQNWPVLVPDLAATKHWPVFAPAAIAIGVAAMFAFPLVLNAHSLGTLEIHRDACGALLPDEIADAVHLADVATALLLDRPAGRSAEDEHGGKASIRTRGPSGPAVRHLFSVANDRAERGLMCTNIDK